MGEEKSVLRWGGIAGILAGIILLIFGLLAVSLVQAAGGLVVVPDFEQNLVDFQANPIPLTLFSDLGILASLLLLVFLVALFWSLREQSRVFAWTGLGLGILALILFVVASEINLVSHQFFSLRYVNAADADRPTVAAVFAGWHSLVTAGYNASLFFLGVAFVAFGGAMRANPGYPEGLAWLSAVLGFVIVLLPLLILNLYGLVPIGLLGLVLGWKIYSLSRAA